MQTGQACYQLFAAKARAYTPKLELTGQLMRLAYPLQDSQIREASRVTPQDDRGESLLIFRYRL
jgi:hypothetical protein